MPLSRMITRTFTADGTESHALYSDCERYRYALTRIWTPAAKRLNIVMLNPSKATELRNDPTIERCERRTRALGYGAMSITNLFAWRETSPSRLRMAKRPVGPENDSVLAREAGFADDILLAWGVHGAFLGRSDAVIAILAATGRPMYHLGRSKAGHPRHPLYIAYAQHPIAWG